MTEKYRKIVQKPLDLMHKAREKVKSLTPKSKPKKVIKTSALIGMDLTEFMMRFIKVGALDNKILRKLEKKLSEIKVGKDKNGYDKKFHAFVKKNPNLSALAIWWSMLGMLIGGSVGLAKTSDKDFLYEPETINQVDDEVFETGTYGAYFDNMRTITHFLIADLIVKEGVQVDKNGMHVPYPDSRGVWTIGFGSTMLKDGSRVTPNTPPITTEEAYELARWHLEEGETYFCMYCYDVAFETVDINDVAKACAMGSIIYNSFSKCIENPEDNNCKERFAMLRSLYKEYGRGLTDDMVKEAFKKYPVVQPTSFGKAWLGGEKTAVVADKLGGFLAGGRGLYWRRWLEAGLMTGKITPKMMLDCPVLGMYDFFQCMGETKEAFFTKDANGNMHANTNAYNEFQNWIQNPVDKFGNSLSTRKNVRDYMPTFALEACDGQVCKLGNKASKTQRVHQRQVEHKTYVLNYNTAYNAAIAAYKAGDYESAAKQLEVLVANNPGNALLHNDLAATYNRLGRYDDAILHAKEIVHKIGDKTQYAAAQYNAGFAYEQKGDLQKALANYKLAVANGNRRVQKDVTRVQNQILKRSSVHTVAFNDATARVGAKAKKDNTSPLTCVDKSNCV